MPDVVIENPVINSAFAEPRRHFKFSDDGITNEIEERRRVSAYFIPIPRARKQGGQSTFDTEWTDDRLKQNNEINRIRERVKLWRSGGYAGITSVTRRLIEHWINPARERKLFFCQVEALETAIYITECASKFGDGWMHDFLRKENDGSNPGLPRIALKMATGSGKTVVMAMLIAWQALNKFSNSQDAKFSDTFLIVTPGITIKDRLRVLLPNDSENYYRVLDLAPPDLREQLNQARILITNYHAFQLREKLSAPKLTKKFLNPDQPDFFRETPDEMVRRVCKEFGNKKNIVVLNDEAHHCYKRRPEEETAAKLTGDDRKEAEQRNEEARIWINGIEAVKAKIGVKAIYDLSATPFFLRGSGWPEGTLFPWVVSDFSLVDAIESGIVKVPRVPVADDSMTGELPTYRDLWQRIKEGKGALPRKGRGKEAATDVTKLPQELQGALHTLYTNYEKSYRKWEESDARQRGQTSPVFIVVCNNTNVSKLVYDYVSGYEKQLAVPLPPREGLGEGQPSATVLVPGELSVFSNVKDGRWLGRPNTILVDSTQLESGESMSPEFKKAAAYEIEEFKNEYRARFPGKDAEKVTDEDILREVMNTVGKAGKLGENVKCVVSVSMLTEGWDANTVTHILGVRAFGTQLLCEQVVGRGLRRVSYAADDNGMFSPEYAEVYGVPFSFIPCSGATPEPVQPKPITRVRALEERRDLEIAFPKLVGYRYEIPDSRLSASFTSASKLILSTKYIPTQVENAPIIGETAIHRLEDVLVHREQEVAFRLAKETIRRFLRDADDCERMDLFPQVFAIAREWLDKCVTCKDNTFKQLLLFHEPAEEACEKIWLSIVRSAKGEPVIKPILRPYEFIGSTRYIDFDTTKPTYATRREKCHISHVALDSFNWEAKMAQAIEDMPEVVSYVKNQNLGFTVPYTIEGRERDYYPDFIVVIDLDKAKAATPHGRNAEGSNPQSSNPAVLNLILEVSGMPKRDKQVKAATVRDLWVPAVNNHGGFGRWAYLETREPWDAVKAIRKLVAEATK